MRQVQTPFLEDGPQWCIVCQKHFSAARAFKDHLKSDRHRTAAGEDLADRPFVCWCGEAFLRRSALVRHEQNWHGVPTKRLHAEYGEGYSTLTLEPLQPKRPRLEGRASQSMSGFAPSWNNTSHLSDVASGLDAPPNEGCELNQAESSFDGAFVPDLQLTEWPAVKPPFDLPCQQELYAPSGEYAGNEARPVRSRPVSTRSDRIFPGHCWPLPAILEDVGEIGELPGLEMSDSLKDPGLTTGSVNLGRTLHQAEIVDETLGSGPVRHDAGFEMDCLEEDSACMDYGSSQDMGKAVETCEGFRWDEVLGRTTPVGKCPICKRPFESRLDDLREHVSGHLKELACPTLDNFCGECCVGFLHADDLAWHRKRAAEGHCGFQFPHSSPCHGHHPPESHQEVWSDTDNFRLAYMIRDWEQSQLHVFMSAVDTADRKAKHSTRTSVPAD
jgi:hypothetical protein